MSLLILSLILFVLSIGYVIFLIRPTILLEGTGVIEGKITGLKSGSLHLKRRFEKPVLVDMSKHTLKINRFGFVTEIM